MTEPLRLVIDPLDTLMFRDGRPFNQSDAGASEATSVFPPHPPTIVGAIRAMLWRSLGTWEAERLGCGTDWQDAKTTLGSLKFGAPLVVREGAPVFPAPLHIVKGEDGRITRLLPGKPLETDLGVVRLPETREHVEGVKTIEDTWLTVRGLEAVLAGDLPESEDWIGTNALWQRESRVGIGIDTESRRTDKMEGKGGQLYMASHIRLSDTTRLAVTLEGWDEPSAFARDASPLTPVAGEHRMARIELADLPAVLPAPPPMLDEAGGKTRYFAVIISPCILDDLNEAARHLKGDVVSACLGKAQMIGGWNSQGRKPVPLRPALPVGSVWFMESDLPAVEILGLHGTHIGVGADWGFGQIVIGSWQEGR